MKMTETQEHNRYTLQDFAVDVLGFGCVIGAAYALLELVGSF